MLHEGAQSPVRLACVYVKSEHIVADVPSRELVVKQLQRGFQDYDFKKVTKEKLDELTKATIRVLKKAKMSTVADVNGRMVQVQIPQGLQEGMQFQVQA